MPEPSETLAAGATDSMAVIKSAASFEAYERHGGELPEGFRFYFRRYGNKGGGRWRGVDIHGCWVESQNEAAVLDELWWLVAAHEADLRAQAAAT